MPNDITQWTSTPFQRIHELPAAAGVYIVFAGTACLYAGKSLNLKGRWRTHPRSMDLVLNGATEVRWREIPKDSLELIEMDLIQEHNPHFNVRVHLPRRGPVQGPGTREGIKFEGEGYIGMAPAWRCGKCGHVWLVTATYDDGSIPTHCTNFKCRSRVWHK